MQMLVIKFCWDCISFLRVRDMYVTHHFFLDLPYKVAEVTIRMSLFVSECREKPRRNREQQTFSLS